MKLLLLLMSQDLDFSIANQIGRKEREMYPDTDLSPDWKYDLFCRIGETTHHNRNRIFKFYFHCRM